MQNLMHKDACGVDAAKKVSTLTFLLAPPHLLIKARFKRLSLHMLNNP